VVPLLPFECSTAPDTEHNHQELTMMTTDLTAALVREHINDLLRDAASTRKPRRGERR
jgi:hypothetical protein